MLPKAVIWLHQDCVAKSMEVASESIGVYFGKRSLTGDSSLIGKSEVVATAESGQEAAARVTRARTHAYRYDQRIRELQRKREAGIKVILEGGDA